MNGLFLFESILKVFPPVERGKEGLWGHEIPKDFKPHEVEAFFSVPQLTQHSPQKGGEEEVRRNSCCSLGTGDTAIPLFSDKPESTHSVRVTLSASHTVYPGLHIHELGVSACVVSCVRQ